MQEENNKRTRAIQRMFRVTESENRRIKERMQEHSFKNFENFARNMVLEGEVKVINFEELRKFRVEVRRIGLNINQVAKQVNMDDEADRDQVTYLLQAVKELNRQVNQLLEREEKRALKGEIE